MRLDEEFLLLPDTRANQPSPSAVGLGALYYVTDEGKLERSNGTTWDPYSAPGGTGDIRADGTVDFAADQSMGGFKLTDGADPVNPQDFATRAWVLANGGGGLVVQLVKTVTGAVATGGTVIPLDDTIPQNTEGDQFMSLAITPHNVANILRIDVVCFLTSNAGNWLTAALFQDATAGALAAYAAYQNIAGGGASVVFTYFMVAGTTSATTFKVRGGRDASAGSTVTFNGTAGGRLFGGKLVSSITITELLP